MEELLSMMMNHKNLSKLEHLLFRAIIKRITESKKTEVNRISSLLWEISSQRSWSAMSLKSQESTATLKKLKDHDLTLEQEVSLLSQVAIEAFERRKIHSLEEVPTTRLIFLQAKFHLQLRWLHRNITE